MTDDILDMDSLIATIRSLRLEVGALREAPGRSQLEPQVSLPSKFDGNRERCRDFMNQVRLIFRLQPQRYNNDRTKIGFIGTLLTGTAAAWFSPHFEADLEIMSDLELFTAELEDAFGDLDRASVAANNIRTLHQGFGTVSEYAAAFRRIICDLDWGDGAYVDQFRRGLRDDVKDLMLTLKVPTTLHEAISGALACDNRLLERKAERKGFSQSRPQQVNYRRENQGPTPMELDAMVQSRTQRRGPLSPEESERRRRSGLCMYCGEPGHMLKDCQKAGRRFQNFGVRQ